MSARGREGRRARIKQEMEGSCCHGSFLNKGYDFGTTLLLYYFESNVKDCRSILEPRDKRIS